MDEEQILLQRHGELRERTGAFDPPAPGSIDASMLEAPTRRWRHACPREGSRERGTGWGRHVLHIGRGPEQRHRVEYLQS